MKLQGAYRLKRVLRQAIDLTEEEVFLWAVSLGVLPAKVVVLGGGVVGTQAARMAVGLGANVEILDRSLPRIRELDDIFQGRATTRYSNEGTIEDSLTKADVVIGAVLVPGANAPLFSYPRNVIFDAT